MKEFKDLEFKNHPSKYMGGQHATLKFDNGFGVSVLCGNSFYSNGIDTYELAIINKDGRIDYHTGITDDVMGYLTEQEVSDVMRKVQMIKEL